jgi:hypothetical protein
MSIIPALGRLRQEDCDTKASLGYIMRTCLRIKKKQEGELKEEEDEEEEEDGGWEPSKRTLSEEVPSMTGE